MQDRRSVTAHRAPRTARSAAHPHRPAPRDSGPIEIRSVRRAWTRAASRSEIFFSLFYSVSVSVPAHLAAVRTAISHDSIRGEVVLAKMPRMLTTFFVVRGG
jgi:hypothetical protein